VRQLDAELRRFFARRIVRGLFLIAALIVVLSVSIGTAKGHRGSEFSLDPATGQVTDPATGQVVAQRPSGEFSTQFGGTDENGQILFGQSDTRMNIGKSLNHALEGTGIALLLASFAIGASFVGAEFNVGSLTTQLLFEPRRWRVHLAKAVAVAVGAALVAFTILLLVALAMYIGSEARGVMHGVDAWFALHHSAQALRVSGIVGVGAMLAYSVTLVARRSSAGMTLFFLQFPLLSILNPTKMPWGLISHYAPLRGLLAVVMEHTTDVTGPQDRAIHTTAGGVVLTAVWVVVIVGASGTWFARSEVR
jgi:hypothetical protein